MTKPSLTDLNFSTRDLSEEDQVCRSYRRTRQSVSCAGEASVQEEEISYP